jgi:CubicO group peptidase (beta-lactamase class C family)
MADLHQFMVNVGNELKDKTVGWAVAIYQGTTLVLSDSGGSSVLNPAHKMTSEVRMDVMSMSKTISAAAIVCLLPWRSLTYDSLIAPYFPSTWKHGPNVEHLTFRMILTHTTGLVPVSEGPDKNSLAYANLKAMIANGAPGSVPATGKYLNEGYALLRVLLPGVFYSRGALDSWEAQNPANFPQVIANLYLNLCKTTVLADPSLSQVSVVPTGPLPFTDIYCFQNTAIDRPSGSSTDDLYSGPDHWYVSAREYGRFIVDLRQGTYVAGTNCWNTMSQTRTPIPNTPEPPYPGGDVRLGMWRFAGKHGEYFGHNGGLDFSDGTHTTGSFAGWMAFPDGVTGVLLANSNLWFGYEQEKILMDSYDNA